MHHIAVTAFSASITLALLATSASAQDDRLQLMRQAREAAAGGKHTEAVELLDRVIALGGASAGMHRMRGRERFCAGDVKGSIADFDRVAQLTPAEEKTLWERGISHYYAGRFDDGAKQFELYQTYHNADVENAAWRYMCVARSDGIDAARRSLLPIEGDRRIPMMKIYAMFKGEATPADVLQTAKAGEPDERELNQRLFYAHLYIGLFHEAAGQHAKAKEHIAASVDHPIGHYMHDVARIHFDRLNAQAKPR